MRFLLCLLPFFCLLLLILTVQGTHRSRVRPVRQQNQNPQNLPTNTNANNPSGQTGSGTNRNVPQQPASSNTGQGGGPRGQAHFGTGGLKKRYSGFPDADDVDMSRSRWRSRDYPDGRNRIDGRRDNFYSYYRQNEDVVKRDIEPLPVPPVNTNELFKREAAPQPPSPAGQMNTNNNNPTAAGNLQPPNDGQSG